jgi:phosphate transport system ATP-binding protein
MARTSLIRPSTKNALRTRTGMVFQRPTPFPVTIRDNITGGVKLHERLIKSVMDEWAEGPLARAALRDQGPVEVFATGPSGGQQQRLCIAR